MKLRTCDRIGMGRPKEKPYRLRKYMAMIEEAMKDPVSVKMLKIDGKRLMNVLHETPGPKIGFVLDALMEEVLDNPKLNTTEYLEKQAQKLIKLPEKELCCAPIKSEEAQNYIKAMKRAFGIKY
jgi:hypothetical protein